MNFLNWLGETPLATGIAESTWLFPAVEVVHVFAISLVFGTIAIIDLRLLGFGVQEQPIAAVAHDAERWLVRGLAVMITTGILLFMCFATKYYYLTFFWVKMASLLVVIVFTWSVHRRVAMAGDADVRPVWRKFVALMSLLLWTTVAVGGRYIGFP